MVNWTVVLEKTWESLGLQGDQTSQSYRQSVLNIHWKDWCWSWNSHTFVTWHEKLTHWKIPGCLERLRAGGKGDERGWDSWMASPTQWTWVWASSGSWWWTRKPGVLQSLGLHKVRHDWDTEPNWTEFLGGGIMKVYTWVLSRVWYFCHTMDCSPPSSSVHGIFQARILEWVAISFSKGSSWPRNWSHISCFSCIGKQILYHCTMWEGGIMTE